MCYLNKALPAISLTNICPFPQVFTIEMHHKKCDKAGPGDNVGMNIKGLDKGNMPHTGETCRRHISRAKLPEQFSLTHVFVITTSADCHVLSVNALMMPLNPAAGWVHLCLMKAPFCTRILV